MTFKSDGFRVICARQECSRVERIPATELSEARDLAHKLGWYVGHSPSATPAHEQDYCPSCTALLQASNTIGPRVKP